MPARSRLFMPRHKRTPNDLPLQPTVHPTHTHAMSHPVQTNLSVKPENEKEERRQCLKAVASGVHAEKCRVCVVKRMPKARAKLPLPA